MYNIIYTYFSIAQIYSSFYVHTPKLKLKFNYNIIRVGLRTKIMIILVICRKVKYLYGRAQKEINSSNDKINKHVV